MPWGVAIAAVVAAGASIYATSQRPKTPEGYDPSAVLRTNLQLAPELYASTAEFQPKYTALNAQLQRQALLGSPGETSDVNYLDTEQVPERIVGNDFRNKPSDPRAVWRSQTYSPNGGSGIWVIPATSTQVTKTRSVTTPPTPGYLDLIEHDIQPVVARLQKAQRASDIGDVMSLAPQARAALQAAQPDSAALLDMLTKQSTEELGFGATLDPGLAREVEQSVRSSQGLRGFGYGQSDVYQEAMVRGSAGQQLRQQRQAAAARAIGLNQGFYGDPYQQILGRPSGVTPNSLTATAANLAQTNQLSPNLETTNSIMEANFNAQAAANIAGYNSQQEAIGGGARNIGSLASAYLNSLNTGTGTGSTYNYYGGG